MSKLYDTTCVRFETVEDRGWVSTQYFRTSGPYGVVERPEAKVWEEIHHEGLRLAKIHDEVIVAIRDHHEVAIFQPERPGLVQGPLTA